MRKKYFLGAFPHVSLFCTSERRLRSVMFLFLSGFIFIALAGFLSPTAIYADSLNAGIKDQHNKEQQCNAEAELTHAPYMLASVRKKILMVKSAAGTIKDRRKSCDMLAKQAIEGQKAGKLLIIDTRDARRYSAYHAPESLNIQSNRIKTKAYLKGESIVLLGDDPLLDGLYSLCNSLVESGFKKVGVVKGGMPAWIASNGGLIGTPENNVDVIKISSEQLFGLERSSVVVVDATRGKVKDIVIAGGSITSIKYKQSIQSVGARISRMRKKQALAYVVLVSDAAINRNAYIKLKKSLANLDFRNLYYLDVTLKQYRQFVRKQKAMWSYIANKPKYVSPCARRS